MENAINERLRGIKEELHKLNEQLAAAERTGHWIQNNLFVKPICSECGESCIGLHGFDYTLTKYCPHCGAKMEVEHETHHG